MKPERFENANEEVRLEVLPCKLPDSLLQALTNLDICSFDCLRYATLKLCEFILFDWCNRNAE